MPKMVKCIGCDIEVEEVKIGAYALMNEGTYMALGITPTVLGVGKQGGTGRFHAAPVCVACHIDPANRKRKLKAHFALPAQLPSMLKRAGSSGNIGR